jgi:hypothetical protein
MKRAHKAKRTMGAVFNSTTVPAMTNARMASVATARAKHLNNSVISTLPFRASIQRRRLVLLALAAQIRQVFGDSDPLFQQNPVGFRLMAALIQRVCVFVETKNIMHFAIPAIRIRFLAVNPHHRPCLVGSGLGLFTGCAGGPVGGPVTQRGHKI